MRRTLLPLVVLAALLALVTVLATSAGAARHHRYVATLTVRTPAARDLGVTRADYALRPHQRHPSLRARVNTPLQPAVFVAVGWLRSRSHRGLSAFVVVVNRRPAGAQFPDRPSASLKLWGPGIRSRAGLSYRYDPFTTAAPPTSHRRALCAGIRGAAGTRDFKVATHAGTSFGFGTADVLAQGYNAACGRAVQPSFRAAVSGPRTCPGGSTCCASGSGSASQPAYCCAPHPGSSSCCPPPCPGPPRAGARSAYVCPQSSPPPMYACPLEKGTAPAG